MHHRRSSNSRLLTIVFILLLFPLGALHAQTSDLPVVAQSLDGAISVRLPQNWMSRDAAAPIFTDVLVFGDSAASVQNVVDALRGASTATAGLSGTVGIVTPQLVSGLPADLAVSTLLNALITDTQNTGGQLLEQQSIMIGGVYPGTVAVVTVPGAGAKGLVGVFQAGGSIVEFSIGASPEAAFDANRQMFIDLMNSIRVPGEAGTVQQPTTVLATAIPAPADQPASSEPLARSESGLFSLRLPDGWPHQTLTIDGFSDTLAFGSAPETMQAIVDLVVGSGAVTTFAGIGGLIGAVDPAQIAGQPSDAVVSELMQGLVTSVASPGVDVITQPQPHTFGGQYAGQLTTLNIGYLAVLQAADRVLVAMLVTDDLEANRATMEGMLESIRLPAETGAETPAVSVPAAAAPVANQLVRSSDDQLSLELPGDWNFSDRVADAQIFAYGDSEAAAQSRLASARPDLAEAAAISGNGGLVILYPMDRFGIDPQSPDLTALMQQALGQLPGYTGAHAPQALAGHEAGLVATIAGAERGFLALIPFGDQIAYVTATGTAATFDGARATLFEVLQSVHIPAAVEESGQGLGGLGGLDAAVTPTAAGLGGL